jgi:hypothetical protein
MMENRSH